MQINEVQKGICGIVLPDYHTCYINDQLFDQLRILKGHSAISFFWKFEPAVLLLLYICVMLFKKLEILQRMFGSFIAPLPPDNYFAVFNDKHLLYTKS